MHKIEIATREGSSGHAEETDITLDGAKFGGVQEASVSIVAGEAMPLVTLTFYADIVNTQLECKLSTGLPKS